MTEELIYQSRNSQIFLLHDSEWDFPVIRKTLNSEYPSPAEIARFYNEFDIISGLHIEGTRKALKRARHKHKHALYLEYVDAVPLLEAFRGKQNDIIDFLHIAIAISKALGNIHRLHIIHKDISASNILVDLHKRTSWIIDFGISSKLDLKTPNLGNPERLEGNLHYISPEQTGRMNRVVDYRSDLYSMGVVFYQMLAGCLPFESKDAMGMVHAHIALRQRPLHEANDRVPEPISWIIDRLLQKNAEDRYQSAYGVADDLERCLEQYGARKKIDPFELGTNDHSGKFVIPQKLYGREREISVLMDSFDHACEGHVNMVLVAGYSGTGKSALVHEIHKPITTRRGHFIEGKFDQFQRGVPYFAILQAFRDYVNLLLTETTERIEELGRVIQSAVGREGRVLTDVIPNLVHIIGNQLSVPEVGGIEAQNRFNYVFKKFLSAIATREHPVALFIDDLQWADAASINLMKVMMRDQSNGYFLCIGAYRDNEVSPSHPFMIALTEMREAGVDIRTIEIGNLSDSDVQEIISDSVSRPPGDVESLSCLVYEKTHGNAFFVNQFIKTLYQEGLLHFVPEEKCWRWELEGIWELNITDNVVELMAGKIRRLPAKTQDALKLAACIGNSFDLETLSIISERGVDDVRTALHDALADGFLTPVGESLKFSHDRIQQAVYSLIPESERQRVHLTIGKLLLQNTSPETMYERLFDIVNQWNSGRDIIDNPADRLRLAELNLRAGVKAKQSSAFRPAYQYLDTGIQLLPRDHWRDHYELSRDLFTQAAETAYLNGDFQNMDDRINVVLENARELLEKVVPYEIRILALKAENRLIDAINTGIEVLRQLGEAFPAKPTMVHVMVDLVKTRARLIGVDVLQIADLPDMTDPRKVAAMRIIADIASSSYWATPALFPLLIFRMCRLSLKYGNTSLSAFGFATYGVILCGVLGAMKSGYEFGKLGLILLDRFEAREWLTQIYTPIYALINNWNEHVENTLSPLQESYHIGLETGAIEFACINANIYCIHAYLTGRTLTKIESETRAYSESFDHYKQETNFNYNQVYHQGMLNFMGRSENPLILTGDAYDEEKMLIQSRERNDQTGTFFIHFNKLILSYYFHDYERATHHAAESRSLLQAVLAKFEIPNHHFYEALSLLGVYAGADRREKARIMRRVRGNLRKLQKWANDAPENYLHKFHLVEAERLRVLGKDDLARMEYDRAIEGASRQRYMHEEALAYELAGRFYIQRNSEGLADYHIKAAYNAYREWGAEAKLRHLEECYPENISRSRGNSDSLGITRSLSGVTMIAERSMLDLTTVLKASTAISGEIVLKNLLRTMMKIVIENAGADRGILLLNHDSALLIQARYDGADDIEVLQGTPIGSGELVAESVIQYVNNAHESVVVNNARNDERYANDPYILRQAPQSLLAMPIVNQGKLIGILYLENSLTTGAFTSNRIDLLTLMSGQIAVSIENARLYQKTQDDLATQTALTVASRRFVPQGFLSGLGCSSVVDVQLNEASEQMMNVLFADLRSFTELSKQMGPLRTVKMINRYLSHVQPSIAANHGFVGQYYGDGVLALFPGEASDSIHGAIAMCRGLDAYNREREDFPELRFGIGIHSGPVTLGTIGDPDHFQCSVVGDSVNLASRMEALTKFYGATLLVSGATYSRMGTSRIIAHRHLGPVQVPGRSEIIDVYECLNAYSESKREKLVDGQEIFDKAIAAYIKGQWAEAGTIFDECIRQCPDDKVSLAFSARCLKRNQHPIDWKGIERPEKSST